MTNAPQSGVVAGCFEIRTKLPLQLRTRAGEAIKQIGEGCSEKKCSDEYCGVLHNLEEMLSFTIFRLELEQPSKAD